MQQQRHLRQQPSREDTASQMHSPIGTPEQTISSDVLQAAYSAKYYEAVTKCKTWEKYAAKLQAQVDFLEAENRVLKDQNAKLETENAHMQVVLRQQERTRTQLEDRMITLEDTLTQRSLSGSNLSAQYRHPDVLEFDHISIPSAPSSVEKSDEKTQGRGQHQGPYCSSNLQVEDRPELRRRPGSNQLDGVGGKAGAEPTHHPTIPPREMSFEAMRTKWENMLPLESIKSPQLPFSDLTNIPEGRSSRLGNRSDVMPNKHLAHRRSGTIGVFDSRMPLRSGSVMGTHPGHALTTQALAQQDAFQGVARPASAQRFNGTHLESNFGTTAANIAANTAVIRSALQSKRRSTVSSDRAPSKSIAQIVQGALVASGAIRAGGASSSQPPSRRTSPNEKPLTTSEYLQEQVEKRREAMRSSFNAQQQQHRGITPGSGGGHPTGVPSRPVSRAASRLSIQSGTRSRSRAGSVHDAIPVAVEDVFCNQTTVIKSFSNDTTPEQLAEQLANTCLEPRSDLSSATSASQRLMAALDTQANVRLMTRKDLSPISLLSAASSPQHQDGEQVSFERRLYIRFQQELDREEFQKFERCIQRYDFLEIPLEGNKGLITRVKKLLLVSDPDIREKPDKLRVRQMLARDFERMAKNFNNQASSQASSQSSTVSYAPSS